ncbi:MAG: two-component system response regulator FixJ [Pseudohongiellaceae bacterium]|jgi:two-component system response regulator FixJ
MKSNSVQTVTIVDDDEAVRDSIAMLIRSIGLAAKSFDSGVAFLQQYDPAEMGCLILDIRMPVMGGLEVQEELLLRNSTLPIIFISGHGDIPMAVKAVKKGAIDFISKPFREQELLDCVQRALIINDELKDRVSDQLAVTENLVKLSPREKEVMNLMIEGSANKVIAIDLGISQRTVEVHRAHVMEKTGARSLAQLVKMIASLPD